MTLTYRFLVALAGAGSAAILLGAFGFQHIGGLEPCAMCFWQRWPHAIAIAIAALGLALPRAFIALAGALNMAVSAGLAIFHSGVERQWWIGPSSCTSRGVDLTSGDCGLLDPTCGTAIVLCDQIPWAMFGLSMANYNVFGSLALMGVWLLAAKKAYSISD
jgi:disulfide bond formation protein DsbB